MQIYSVSPIVRTRQIAGDLTAAAFMLVAVLLGVSTGVAIAAFGEFGRQVAQVGQGLQQSMLDASSAVGGLPLVGEAAAAPFREASEAGAGLIATGEQQQSFASTTAVVVGLLIAVVPIAVILRVWLRRRVAFARRAALATRLASTVGGTELLALRALTEAAPSRLLALGPDPVAAWRAGDAALIRVLADIELRGSGVLR